MSGVPRAEGVRLLWEHDYYDGPVSGLAEWRGEQWWFDVADPDGGWHRSDPRAYVLRRLTPEELAAEWAEHREFERLVGPEMCLDHEGVPPRHDRPPQEAEASRASYHAEHPFREAPYRDRPVAATFEH